MMSEIRISKIDDDYFINGKKVVDPLDFPIKERMALDAYKSTIESGIQIKSTFKDSNKIEKKNEEPG